MSGWFRNKATEGRDKLTLILDFLPKVGDRVSFQGHTIIVKELFHNDNGNFMRYQYENQLPEYEDVLCTAPIVCLMG